MPIPDAFIYAEKDGGRYVFVGSLEIPRIQGIDGIVTVPLEELGIDELYSRGLPWYEAERELVLRACRKISVESAVTPRAFPLDAADHLRSNGVSLEARGELFDERRSTVDRGGKSGARTKAGATGVLRGREVSRRRARGEWRRRMRVRPPNWWVRRSDTP